jgi:hypothetical protein
LREITPDTLEFGIGAPSFAMMAKLKPLLAEATKQRMVCHFAVHLYKSIGLFVLKEIFMHLLVRKCLS